MSLQEIRDYRNSLETDSLEYKIASCFLKQPTQIGIGIGNLRRLNFSNQDDLSVFIGSVLRDLESVHVHFLDAQRKIEIYNFLKGLLLNKSN
jgi:hypothetical protein